MKAFAEEMKALAYATQVLKSETVTAEGHTYSLFQVSSFTSLHTTVDLKGFEVVTMVRRLAQKEHSVALSQLASRISIVVLVLSLAAVLVSEAAIKNSCA